MKNARLSFARYSAPMLAVMIAHPRATEPRSRLCQWRLSSWMRRPNGAVGVLKAYPHRYGYGYHRPVNCAHGPYRAGCVGPHGLRWFAGHIRPNIPGLVTAQHRVPRRRCIPDLAVFPYLVPEATAITTLLVNIKRKVGDTTHHGPYPYA
jgi:hypothetical protein